jgi:uncharacterized protein with NAD-binding domain and iron-sulfur cluster
VLKKREVKFAFFHAVRQLRPSADGRRLAEIEIVPQVAIRGDEYRPLIPVDHEGKPLWCWPDRPLFGQLVGGRRKNAGVDFEHSIDPLRTPERITLVAGDDFDVAILAVPPPVQRRICGGLRRANRRYAEMLACANTVVTQAAQLWLDRTPEELGWDWRRESLMSMYVEPIDTYCDMSHLIACEHWPRDRVHHIAYFCGVIPHPEAARDPEGAVRRHTREFLERDAGRFWPKVATRPDRTGFDWDRLVAPAGAKGASRLRHQYLRVNHQPSERYVLTLAGTVDARVWPDERCFDNLVFAGDWTRNGFDAGCVEGAMTSGMLAAQAICGHPEDARVAGLDGPAGFPNGPALFAGSPLDGGVAGVLLRVGRGLARRLCPR